MAGLNDVGLSYDANDATPRTLGTNDLRGVLAVAGWSSGDDFRKAYSVVMCESGGKTDAESANPAGGRNIGIFQIWEGNVQHPERLKSPRYSANVARRMWRIDGGTFNKRWACKEDSSKKVPLEDDATNPVDSASRSISSGIDAVGDFFNVLQEGSTWKRVGFVVGGGLLIGMATLILAGEILPKVSPVTRMVGK